MTAILSISTLPLHDAELLHQAAGCRVDRARARPQETSAIVGMNITKQWRREVHNGARVLVYGDGRGQVLRSSCLCVGLGRACKRLVDVMVNLLEMNELA